MDPNRNYGAFWGGPGADTNPLIQTYRGPSPFSEPESQNVRELVSGRQVTTLITNHTFSGLVLRPPGIAAQGSTPDEPIYKALGARMAAENGYANQYGYELYDTTGTTEDWSYWSTGGLGFTFEIGDLGFHPPFAETVAEWNGTSDDATGGGNRAAYYHAQENTARRGPPLGARGAGAGRCRAAAEEDLPDAHLQRRHVHGHARDDPAGRLRRNLRLACEPVHAPARLKSSGRPATGAPSAPQQFTARGGTVPCANFDTPPASCYEDHVITVPSGTGIDNAQGHVPDRVADAGQRLRHEGLPRGRGRERDRRADRRVRPGHDLVRGGRPHRAERQVRGARRQLRGRRALDGHVTFAGPDQGPRGDLDALLRAAGGHHPLGAPL